MGSKEVLGAVEAVIAKQADQVIEHAISSHENHDRSIERTNAATLEMSAAALKALLFLNGGATIAMLGFLGAVASGQDDWAGLAKAVYGALISFSVGSGLAVLATSMAYLVSFAQVSLLTTYKYQWEHPYVVETSKTKGRRRLSNFLHFGAILFATFSLAAFGCGVGQVASGMDTVIKNAPTNIEAAVNTNSAGEN